MPRNWEKLGRLGLHQGNRSWDAWVNPSIDHRVKNANYSLETWRGLTEFAGMQNAPADLEQIRKVTVLVADQRSVHERLTIGVHSWTHHAVYSTFSTMIHEKEIVAQLCSLVWLADGTVGPPIAHQSLWLWSISNGRRISASHSFRYITHGLPRMFRVPHLCCWPSLDHLWPSVLFTSLSSCSLLV
jgi:hypothetical protein